MDSNRQQRNVGVDYLTIRLRRIVRLLLEKDKTAQHSPCFDLLYSKEHHVFAKIFGTVAFIICIAMFLTQVHDRTSYYLTYPITTDVFIVDSTEETMPDVTICHDPPKAGRMLYAELGIPLKTCGAYATELFTQRSLKLSFEEAWKKLNGSEGVISAKLVGKSSSENLTYSSIFLPHGTCTTFHGNSNSVIRTEKPKIEIVFSFDGSLCQFPIDYIYLHESNDHPLSRYEHEADPSIKNKLQTSIRKYHFQSRKRHPCISNEEHSKCVHDCFTKYSSKAHKCRFPFQPTESKIPECDSSETGNTNWEIWKAILRYMRGQEFDDCQCTRKCNLRIFDDIIEQMDAYINQSVYILEFSNSHVTIINERFVYTLGKLMADIGGNSGLWIGLSVLSIFYLLPLQHIPRKNKNSISTSDPLYLIVYKRMKKDKIIGKYSQVLNTDGLLYKGTNWFFIVCQGVACLMFSYAVFNRISYFYQYPVQSVVEISFMQTLDSPSLTVCPGNIYLDQLKREYANHTDVSDFCDVQFWQLLGLSDMNVEKLWTRSKGDQQKFQWGPVTSEYLIDGVCFNTLHKQDPVAAKAKNYQRSLNKPMCGKNYMKAYLKPPTGHYDYFLYAYIMTAYKHSISYVLKRIAANEHETKCVEEKMYEECRDSCLKRKLEQRLKCRLPFMPPSNLSRCESPISAKHALDAYFELFVLPTSSDDCDCLPACYKHIYQIEVESEPMPVHWGLSYGFGAKHNVMETYRKERVYPAVAFLCDIGGWLGSTLGLCVFNVIEVLLHATKIKPRKR